MSTAHRPTWNPRQAGADAVGAGVKAPPTFKVSERDQAGHTKLRTRRLAEPTPEESVDEELLQLTYAHGKDDGDANVEEVEESAEEFEDDLELQTELAKVRAERDEQVAQARFQIESSKQSAGSSWLDDAPFASGSKRPPAPASSKATFINDSTRSDYHRQFMSKFIR